MSKNKMRLLSFFSCLFLVGGLSACAINPSGSNSSNGGYGDVSHQHSYTENVAETRYLKTAATCESRAIYYYSCECGARGNSTFEYGEMGDHIPDYSGNCTLCGDPIAATEGVLYDISMDGTHAEVIGYTGSSTKVRLANTYKNLPVTNIYENAFKDTAITSIVIPDSVTDIGESAFKNCDDLASVKFGKGLKRIGEYAFYAYTDLTEVELPDSLEYIGYAAFANCNKLMEMTLPFVGDGEFETHLGYIFGASSDYRNEDYVPRSLKKIILQGATSIGSYAFYDCSNLTNIEIPDSVTWIADDAFYNCNNLAYNVCESVQYLGNANNPYVVVMGVENNNLSSYQIQDGTKILFENSFADCSRLKTIQIPKTLIDINSNAFSNCNNLTDVYITDIAAWCNISGLSNLMFGDKNIYVNNELLTELVIPEGVVEISSYAFANCSDIVSLEVPSTLKNIDSNAFSACSALHDVYTNDLIAWCDISGLWELMVDDRELYINNQLATEVVLPEGVTNIRSYAFAGCTSIVSIEISSSVTAIEEAAFKDCENLDSIKISNVAAWCNISGLSNLMIAGRELYINNQVATEVAIPEGTTNVRSHAFAYCASIVSVEIPSTVEIIEEYAFKDCTALLGVKLPNSINSMGASAFSGCSALTEVTIPFVGASKTSSGASSLFGYIFGKENYTGAVATKQAYANYNGEVVYYIPEGLTKVTVLGGDISRGAFQNCATLTDLILGEGVTSIGAYTFSRCEKLKDVVIADTVTTIGESAFEYCDSLLEIVIPDGVKTIQKYAFAYCNYLECVKFGKNVESLAEGAFYSCWSLRQVDLSSNLTSIEQKTFANCNALKNLLIPKSVTSIKKEAFSNSGLERIKIPKGVTSIGEKAFYYCGNMTAVFIPDSVMSIGRHAFSNCDNLTIYCEAKTSSSGWTSSWNYYLRPVVWGYVIEEPDEPDVPAEPEEPIEPDDSNVSADGWV